MFRKYQKIPIVLFFYWASFALVVSSLSFAQEAPGASVIDKALDDMENVSHIMDASQPVINTEIATIPKAETDLAGTPISLVAEQSSGRSMIEAIEVKNLDINEALKVISLKTGIKIIPAPNVQGQVTIFLKNVDVMDALRIILDMNDLAYSEEDGHIRVMTTDDYQQRFGRAFGDKIQTKVLRFNYADAERMAGILDRTKSAEGKVILDKPSNTVIIIDAPEVVRSMVKFCKEMDVPIKTEVFTLTKTDVELVVNQVQEQLTPNVGRIQFDKAINSIVVTDTAQRIEQIKSFLEDLDKGEMEEFSI